MNKKFGWIAGALVLILLAVGVFGVTSAYADDGNQGFPFKGRGPRGGRVLDGAGLEAVAKVLGMSTDDLSTALKDGKKLSDLADEAGVDMQEIFDALSTVREDSIREHIAQSVEEGTMSQAKADWLLEGLDQGFLDGPGFLGHGDFIPPERPGIDTNF